MRKVAAIAAGVLVIGVGAAYTLASWTDSEWVWGGVEGEPLGTSSFEVEQDTGLGWSHEEANPGGELQFTLAALALAPGDSVYAPVSLRTAPGSIAGSVTLQGAVPASSISTVDDDDELWAAVRVTVHTSDAATAPSCTAADFDTDDWIVVPGMSTADLGTGAIPVTGAQVLGAATAAAGGAPQHYCFVLTLPSDAQDNAEAAGVNLMGRSIAPAWEFAAESD